MLTAAGIYARSEGAVERFFDMVLRSMGPENRRQARKLVFPSDRPVVGAIIVSGSETAIQCATRPDGSFAIIDGEIFDGLDEQRPGPSPGANDAKRLLNLYFAAGHKGIARINGAAVITIWDAVQGVLTQFRDRFGSVPGFFAEQQDGLIWASHISTLLTAGIDRSVNLVALDFYLSSGFVPAPFTLVENIQRIPSGHSLTCARDGSVKLQAYWRPTGQPKLEIGGPEATERLGLLFKQALLRRCSGTDETGVLLSGGVDSKFIVAALVRWLGVPPKSIQTFTFRYTDYDGIYNESESARRCAAHFGVSHHEITYTPTDLAENLERMIGAFGEPFSYGAHSLMLNEVADAGISVLQSGAGPDGWYLEKWEYYGRKYAGLPPVIQALGRGSVSLLDRLSGNYPVIGAPIGQRVLQAARRRLEASIWCGTTGLPLNYFERIFPETLRTELYDDPSWSKEARCSIMDPLFSELKSLSAESDYDKITIMHMKSFTADSILSWNHWIGRQYGLSIRTPYLDNDLIEIVMRLKRVDRGKEILRRSAATVMPRDMAYEPKISQTVPIKEWFRGALKDYLIDNLAPERLNKQGMFKSKVVQRLLYEHLSGRANHHWRLWVVLSLSIWEKAVLRLPPSPG